MSSLVAVLGAAGGVGRHVAVAMDRAGARVRLGGRSAERLVLVRDTDLGGRGEVRRCQLWDDDELSEFCAGADVVVNCAGPSYRVVDRVARAADAAGASCVDPGGDVPLLRALTERPVERPVVVNAGLMPGLTAVLPAWLAEGMERPRSLVAHVGLMDRLTPVGAAEYLITLAGEHGEAQAAWRDGARSPRALTPVAGARVPFFPGRVDLQPYLSLEVERLAARLGLDEVDWWNVFDGDGHMLRTLTRLQGAGIGDDVTDAAAELCAAAELDLFGRTPYQIMTFRLTGTAPGGEPVARTLVLHATDTYAVTAAVAAVAAERLLAGDIRSGVHPVEDVVDPAATAARLRDRPEIRVLDRIEHVSDGPDGPQGGTPAPSGHGRHADPDPDDEGVV